MSRPAHKQKPKPKPPTDKELVLKMFDDQFDFCKTWIVNYAGQINDLNKKIDELNETMSLINKAKKLIK